MRRRLFIVGLLAALALLLASCNLSGSADVKITKTVNTADIEAGQTLTYIITVTNDGPDTAEAVMVSDTLPDGVSLTNADICEDTAGVLSCDLGDLTTDATETLTIVVTVNADATGQLANTATVSSSTKDPDEDNNNATATTTIQLPLPGLTVGEWTELAASAETICANGSAYKYFVNKGSSNKLVIDFEGGGACWDDTSCLAGASSGGEQILYADFVASSTDTLTAGIYDHGNAANPVQDWYHVFVPYCTGDLHVGNVTQSYTNPFTEPATPYTIEHKGAVNAQSVLDWTFDTFSSPESVFITGCSAGGYGAAFWTDTIKANYPDVPVYQLGDCAVGASTDGFAALVEANWDIQSTFPGSTFDKDFANNVYIDTANKYTDSLKMAQYNSMFDQVQIGFYALITGQTEVDPNQVAAEWSGIMQTSIATIDAATSNFNAYTAEGGQHCIIISDNFYTLETDGTKLVDWLGDYLSGQAISNVP